MIQFSTSIKKACDILTGYGVQITRNTYSIAIKIDVTHGAFDLNKVRSLVYLILNKLEKHYFIHIEGAPYCLAPDASNHFNYIKKANTNYNKAPFCQECKFNNSCPGFESNHKFNAFPFPIKDVPNEIVLEITKKCNLRCTVCFSHHSTKELTLDKIKQTIDECVETGVKAVRFSGGEPLLHKNAAEALYYAKSRNLHVILNTNATVLNRNIELAIKNNVDNLLVSLQGFDRNSEVYLTKSPTQFHKKLKNIVKFNSLIRTFRLGTIISKTLIKNFDKYFHLINRLGVNSWELYRPLINDTSGEFNITKDEYLWLMNKIKEVKLSGFDLKIPNPVPFCISNDLELSKYVLFGGYAEDGHSRIVLDVDGYYKPSYFMFNNLGNTILEAWNDPFLKKIRSYKHLPVKCQECSCLTWCMGGSRHLAKSASGDYFNHDPLTSH